MSKIFLESYLNDIVSAYKTARDECGKLWDQMEEAQKRNTEIQHSRAYSAEGKRQAQTDFEDERDDITDALNRACKKAQNAFTEARTGADAVFGDLFGIRPEQIDDHALELLKADILTNAELVELARNYRDNPAMRRLCGKFAEQRTEKDPHNSELRRVAADGQITTPKHLEGIDTLTMWCEKALRPDSRMLSDGIAAELDTHAAEIMESYGGICREL